MKAKAYIVHRAMCEPELEWSKPKDCLSADPLYTTPPQRKPQYDKTKMNCFVQDLYDKKMLEGKHGHYETMFHVVHQAIKIKDSGLVRCTHPVKDLEDIDINITWNENSMRDFGKDELNFARAILRKTQEQEPVAWEQFYPDIGKPQIAFNAEVIGYVAPQRTWVGLTPTQVKLLWEGVQEEAVKSGDSLNWVFYTHINEALKEKNNG